MATIVVVAVIVVIVVIGFVVVVAIAVVIVAVVAVVLIKNDWQQKLIRDQFSLDRIHLILSYNKIEHPIKRKRMCLTKKNESLKLAFRRLNPWLRDSLPFETCKMLIKVGKKLVRP